MASSNMAWAINEALKEEMERDETVFLAGEDIGPGGIFGVTKGLRDKFGEWRVKDTPISEDAICGLAAGAAFGGMKPVVEIMYNDFFSFCLDPILLHAAKAKWLLGQDFQMSLVVRAVCASGIGGGMHHAGSLEAIPMQRPGIKIVYPSNAYDAKGLLKSAIRDGNPVIFIEPLYQYRGKVQMPDGEFLVPIGVANVKKEGTDVTLVSYGNMLVRSLDVANKIAAENISVEVIDLRTISPLDENTIINSVKKTGKLIIVHEAQRRCGVGAEIAAVVAEKALDSLERPIVRVTPPAIPIPIGGAEIFYQPQEEDIMAAIRKTVK